MQGASALQGLLEEFRSLPIEVLVVWEPVLWTDLGPPTSRVLAKTSDARVTQFWDEDRVLSEFMIKAATQDPSLFQPGYALQPDEIVWDVVAIFPPGASWDTLPKPSYYGGPVVEVLDRVRAALSAIPL